MNTPSNAREGWNQPSRAFATYDYICSINSIAKVRPYTIPLSGVGVCSYGQKGLYGFTCRLHTEYIWSHTDYIWLHTITYRLHTVDVITFVMSAMGYILTICITYRLHRENRLPVHMVYVAYVAICSIYAIWIPPRTPERARTSPLGRSLHMIISAAHKA